MPRAKFESHSGDWKKAAKAIQRTVYGAARAAVGDLAQQVQQEARAQISSAGFKGRWVTGFRTYIFPKVPNPSEELVMRGFHSYNIANVFERGAKISGQPLLWIPLPTAPKKIHGKKTTAARLIGAGINLHRIRGSGTPLLAGFIVAHPRNINRRTAVTLQQLRAGQARRGRGRRGRGSRIISIPLFTGLSTVSIRKRFNISEIYKRGSSDLSKFYAKRLKELN